MYVPKRRRLNRAKWTGFSSGSTTDEGGYMEVDVHRFTAAFTSADTGYISQTSKHSSKTEVPLWNADVREAT